jgi:hypothetical protein
MRVRPFREPARILFHLSEGYTRVSLERTEGQGMADGGTCWDIPTSMIPQQLRCIGSRFQLVGQLVRPEEVDSVEDWRSASADSIRVEESS